MLVGQMLTRVRNDIRIAKKCKEKGYVDSFWLAIEHAESTLKVVLSLINREERRKHMEAERYYTDKETQTIERADIPNRFYSTIAINTVRKITLLAVDFYYYMLGWYYVCCDIIRRKEI